MNFELPKTVSIGNRDRAIRWEYRDVLTILAALADPELSQEDKTIAALAIFYPDAEELTADEVPEALERLNWFIEMGQEPRENHGPKLMDWEQDFPYIIAPINRVIGRDVREETPLHWWTFLSAYYEIGDCLFAQIVSIRDKKARGKRLEKYEREWAQKNADLIRFKTKYTAEEEDILKKWAGKGATDAE